MCVCVNIYIYIYKYVHIYVDRESQHNLVIQLVALDCTKLEEPVRNSGHMGGRFSEKRRIVNPATGEYFKLSEPRLHMKSVGCYRPMASKGQLRTCSWGRP